jgi:hypothetical protein
MSDRANWIGAPEAFNLSNVACILNEAFGTHNYLVGSALTSRDHRDVDVRCILPDEEFDKLFPDARTGYQYQARWSLICAAISEWMAKRTGLQIDFQIQRQSEANEKFPLKGHPRSALILLRSEDAP